jgi:predicted phage tail protein
MSSGGRIAGGPLIAGAGGSGGGKGGGGSARTPTTARDSLDSRQYANLVDLISEGEVKGLVNGLKSISLDGTPLQNPDGTFNFQNVTVYTRNGTQNQEPLPFGDEIEDERSVGITVRNDGPVTRTITDSQTDAVRVTINVPRLEEITSNGDTVGQSLRLQIQVQYNGGGFSVAIDDTISGRTADPYQRDYLLNLSGAFPVDIRLVRITADSNDMRLANAFEWRSYTEIIYSRLSYPNTALAGIRIDAEQFNSIPQRSYDVYGIKVKIPSNATVDQTNGRLIYNGVWNGTFGAAQWCSDPAWVLWNELTNDVYGLGQHLDISQLDKWAFFAASQYCSELIPDGFGGWEPRFSCNINIQTSEEAYKLINNLCSIMRAMPYWSAGSLTVSQDRPSDPVYAFHPGNVKDGIFEYSSSSLKTRTNVAVVSYFDLIQRETAYEVVEDAESIARYGVIKTEIEAVGCTSRGQAHRVGEWLIYTERYEGETVSFAASIAAGAVVRPGQIISIADPVRSGVRRGGRISVATTTAITVDDATGLAAGGTLSVVMPDATMQARTVQSITGRVLIVASAFTVAPNANADWLYETSDIQASTWRVLGIGEQDGIDYPITAIAYNASKYAYIERDQPLEQRDTTNLNIIPPAPTNLSATELLYDAGGIARAKLITAWDTVEGAQEYRIRWRPQNGNWTDQRIGRRIDYEILDTTPGVYQIEVYAIGANLRSSVEPASLTVQAFGKTAPPGDVQNVSLVPGDQLSGALSWDRATDLDVLLSGKVLIRHSSKTSGATWEESQEIVAAAAGGQTNKQVPMLEGTYLLKFEDDQGNRSTNAAAITASFPAPQPRSLFKQFAEDQLTTPFSGTKVGMMYSATYDALILESADGVNPVGEYEFSSIWDMGAVYDVNLRRRFLTRPLVLADLWDSRNTDIDTWASIDGAGGDGVNAQIYVRTTADNPGASPAWGEWNEFSNVIARGRGFQFKLRASSEDPNVNILVDELGCLMELQLRTEQSAVLASGAGVLVVTFANPFYQAPNVGITAQNLATGDFFAVTSVSRTGFSIEFKNSAGTSVNRNFTYAAVGYGREV